MTTMTTTTTCNLKDRAILVDLDIAVKTFAKQDKTASANAEHASGTTHGRVKALKYLIDPAQIAPILSVAGEARAYFKEHTLAWDAFRILPADGVVDLLKTLSVMRGKFLDAVETFANGYSLAISESRAALNGLFNAAEYPTDVKSLYYFRWKVRPLPEESDFRLALGDAHLADLRAQLQNDLATQTQLAMKDAWVRLHAAVKKMRDACSSPDAVFRDTLVGNVADLCDVLPGLNLVNDPELTAVLTEVKARLTAHDPETLRKNTTARAAVATDAAVLVNRMSAYV